MKRLLLIAVACAACTNPDDILAVEGSVTSVDSVDGQRVRLLRQRQVVHVFGDWPCTELEPFKEMNTGADGLYDFEVFRLETRETCFRVEATFPSGSVAWATVPFYAPVTRLQPLRDWRANPSLDGGVVLFEPPVPWPDERAEVYLGHRAQLITDAGDLAWQAVDRFLAPDASLERPEYLRGPLMLDELHLEDFEGALTLSAALSLAQEAEFVSAGILPIRMTSGETLNVQGTRVPISRGLPCPELATPCPLTDGLLTEVDAGLIDSVTLNLPAPTRVAAIVVRGAWVGNGRLRVVLAPEDGGVETQVELTPPRPDHRASFPEPGPGAVFTPAMGYVGFQQLYAVIPVDAGTPTSRVIAQFPSGLARIRELSVFE